MTTTTSPTTSAELDSTPPEITALVSKAVEEIASGKIELSEVLARLSDLAPTPAVPVVHVPAITESQRQALSDLPDLYGRVVPEGRRLLSEDELVDIVTERVAIDAVLAFAKKRKDESIRETLANHADLVAEVEREGDDPLPTDAKGHYAVKQEIPVAGTGKKVQRLVSGGKPELTSALLLAAVDSGVLTREEFLSLTKMPESPRVLDSTKVGVALKRDPGLLFRLAEVAQPVAPITTIKVVDDK